MSLVTMPNGEVVDVPDDIAPDALNRIKAQNQPTRAQRVAQGQPRQMQQSINVDPNIKARADAAEKLGNTGSDFGRGTMQGMASSFMDEIGAAGSAATTGVYRAIKNRDIGQIGKTYTETRDTERELDRRAQERSPIASGAGELVGAVMNPVGAGEGLAAGGAKLASKLGAEKAAAALTGASARIAKVGPIGSAALAGANQGALNAAGQADSLGDVPGAALEGAGLGGITGGALGGLTHLGARGIQILREAAPANAERNAYGRVAAILSKGSVDAKEAEALGVAPGTKWTPELAQRSITETDAGGGDAMVQDVVPGLRAQAAAISRKPMVDGSNDLIERGASRIDNRRANFGQQVSDASGISQDALSHGDALAAARKADGSAGYAEGGIMDTPIRPTPELQDYLKNAPQEVQGALKGAYNDMLLRDQKPADFAGPDGIFTHIPNLRTFDYVKRSFDTQIGQALRSGDKSTAQGLSYQLDKLKGVLADANPNDAEYKALLASQRDAFQKQNALDTGKDVLKRITTQPRMVLREFQNLPDHAKQEWRIGVVDALINSDTKADPVAFFRSIMRNDNQRKIMEAAFNGKGNLGRFERYANREVRSTQADALTAPGRQSETSRIAMADDGGDGVGSVLSNAMRGYAFGGTVGAASGVMRTLGNISTGTTRATQEEIAKILLSKGENLVKGTEAASAYTKARDASNRRRAKLLGKAGQQFYSDAAGGSQ